MRSQTVVIALPDALVIRAIRGIRGQTAAEATGGAGSRAGSTVAARVHSAVDVSPVSYRDHHYQ
jgi:hypothetical protein